MRLSINVDNKDALVNFIGVKIRHQNGAIYDFEWRGMKEFFSEVKDAEGGSQIVERDSMPISVKLNTLSLVERFFRFQNSQFIKDNEGEISSLEEDRSYMQLNETSNYPKNFLNSKPFKDYLKFMGEKFCWQAGGYVVEFVLRSPTKINHKSFKYKFTLTQDNVNWLRKNLEEIEVEFTHFLNKQINSNYVGNKARWKWVNPSLTEN